MSDQFCSQCGERLKPGANFCAVCGMAVTALPAPKAPPAGAAQRRQVPWLPLVLIVGAGLVLFGVLMSQANPPDVVDVPDEHDAAGLPYPDVPRISVNETKERLDSGIAIVIDVRSAQEYAEAHIPSALSIPLDELQSRYQELPPDAEIITYCTWPSEESSARAAAILQELGYTDVKAILGGLAAWQEASYPVSSGSQ